MDDEPFTRTRVSRAYYAAYLEARSFAEANMELIRIRSSKEHRDVATQMRLVDVTLSSNLKFLRSLRNSADYELHLAPETIAQNARDAEEFADSIIARLDDLSAAASNS